MLHAGFTPPCVQVPFFGGVGWDEVRGNPTIHLRSQCNSDEALVINVTLCACVLIIHVITHKGGVRFYVGMIEMKGKYSVEVHTPVRVHTPVKVHARFAGCSPNSLSYLSTP